MDQAQLWAAFSAGADWQMPGCLRLQTAMADLHLLTFHAKTGICGRESTLL